MTMTDDEIKVLLDNRNQHMTPRLRAFKEQFGLNLGPKLEVTNHLSHSVWVHDNIFLNYLMENGQYFTYRPKPKGVKFKEQKACFHNAGILACADDRSLTYCEGICFTNPKISMWFHHAWCCDKDDNIIDVTLRVKKNDAIPKYFGVKFPDKLSVFHAIDGGTMLKHIITAV